MVVWAKAVYCLNVNDWLPFQAAHIAIGCPVFIFLMFFHQKKVKKICILFMQTVSKTNLGDLKLNRQKMHLQNATSYSVLIFKPFILTKNS